MKKIFHRKISEDRTLWNFLTANGIRLKIASKTAQTISMISVPLFLMTTIYVVGLCAAAFWDGFKMRIILAAFSFYSLSVLLCYDLFLKRYRLSNLLSKIYHLRKVMNISKSAGSTIVNFLLLAVVLYIILASILYTSFTVEKERHFYTFFVPVKSRSVRNILLMCGAFLSFMKLVFVPSIASITFSVLEYRCSEMLTSYNNQLKELSKTYHKDKAVYLIKMHSTLIDVVEDLKDILSFPLLLLIACNIVGLFMGLITVISNAPGLAAEIEAAAISLTAFFSIFSQGFFGSLIPEKLEAIAKTAGQLVEKYHTKSSSETKDILFHFERMEKGKIIYLNACNLFSFKRDFILHVTGIILTYGLLIINF